MREQRGTPGNTMQRSAIENLFFLVDSFGPNSCGRHPPEEMCRRFDVLFGKLNYLSTCYLIGSGGLEQTTFFQSVLDAIGSFLARRTFAQVSLRPVHSFSPEEWESWIEVYERFLLACRPFQEEGYKQQIVFRLRIFPVICLVDKEAVEAAIPFLSYLRRNFFLPSILFPEARHEELSPMAFSGSGAPWERLYLTRDTGFSAESIVEALAAHAISDTVLEREGSDPFGTGPLCAGACVLGSHGGDTTCLFGMEDSAGAGGDLARCFACMQRVVERTERSFRLSRREDAWREMCERIATGLRKNGRKREAVDVWERCLRGSAAAGEMPLELFLQRALCSYEDGDLETAMNEFAELARNYPESPEVRFYMGLCEFGWRDYIEAADRFREALERGLGNPMKQEAEYLRGESHVHLEEYDDAMEALQKAEQEGRGDSTVYFYQGLCFLGKGRPKEAVVVLRKALERGPTADDLFHVLFYIAHALKEEGSFREALEYCSRAEGLDRNSRELLNLKGFCHYKLKEHDAAIACFERCIEMDPRSAIDYANIGSNLRDKGDMEGAAAMYRKALSLDPSIDFARKSLERIETK